MLLKLSPEKVVIRWLTAKAVPILGEHHRNPTGGHKVSHAVHARPLKARAGVAGIRHLFEDLVALTGRVGPQCLYLLGEGVAGAGLLVCRDAGLEDGPLGATAVRATH